MSDMFAAYNIAETGLSENQEWINAVSDNIANINTDVPTSQAAFQARFIEAQAVGGQSSPGATAIPRPRPPTTPSAPAWRSPAWPWAARKEYWFPIPVIRWPTRKA